MVLIIKCFLKGVCFHLVHSIGSQKCEFLLEVNKDNISAALSYTYITFLDFTVITSALQVTFLGEGLCFNDD